MGSFHVDATTVPGLLTLRLEGVMSVEEMQAFVKAHNAAVDAFRGKEYRVWCDIRTLSPLPPEASELMEAAKRHSAMQRGFLGSAVHVTSAMVAMQHKRTSVGGGVMQTELISDDEEALRAHIATVRRVA